METSEKRSNFRVWFCNKFGHFGNKEWGEYVIKDEKKTLIMKCNFCYHFRKSELFKA